MARRTKIEAAATRQRLLDAAERVFRERGVAHASLAEVASAAGVTRGAVYWHFKDKVDLFEALCERVQLPMEAMLASAGEIRQKDPLGALRALAINGLVRLATNARTQAVFDVIFHKCEFAAELAPLAGRRHATDTGCLANVERLLKQAVRAGQLPRNADTELAARLLNAFMVGVMHEWVQRPEAYDLGHAAPALIDSVLAGLVSRPPLRTPAKSPRMAAKPLRDPVKSVRGPVKLVRDPKSVRGAVKLVRGPAKRVRPDAASSPVVRRIRTRA